MNKQIFTTVLLWALAQAYMLIGIGFVLDNFMISTWNELTRVFFFFISTIIIVGFIGLFMINKKFGE